MARTAWGDDCLLVGFTTDHGTVTAASEWGGPAERKRVRPALPRLERAIGVIYRPDTERQSHWFVAHMPQQFDAVVHIDETSAVEPLERTALWDRGEAPETYPTGL